MPQNRGLPLLRRPRLGPRCGTPAGLVPRALSFGPTARRNARRSDLHRMPSGHDRLSADDACSEAPGRSCCDTAPLRLRTSDGVLGGRRVAGSRLRAEDGGQRRGATEGAAAEAPTLASLAGSVKDRYGSRLCENSSLGKITARFCRSNCNIWSYLPIQLPYLRIRAKYLPRKGVDPSFYTAPVELRHRRQAEMRTPSAQPKTAKIVSRIIHGGAALPEVAKTSDLAIPISKLVF